FGVTAENQWLLPTGVTAVLNHVSGESDDAAWAVGAGGTVLRFDGTDWHEVPTDFTVDLHAVQIIGDRIIAVGAEGTVVRSEDGGESWTVDQPSAALGMDLHAIVRSGDELFAVGD